MRYEKHLPYVILPLITEQKVLRYYKFIEPAKQKKPHHSRTWHVVLSSRYGDNYSWVQHDILPLTHLLTVSINKECPTQWLFWSDFAEGHFSKGRLFQEEILRKKRQFSQKWISTFLLFRGCFKSPLLALNAPLQSSPQVHFWTMIFVILICTTLQWILTQTMNMWLKKRLSVLIQVIKKIIPLGIILIFTHSLPFSEAQK